MTKTRSMTDVAYEVMSSKKRAIPFKKLWTEVIEKLNLDPEKATDRIAQFYTDMTLDGRFTSLKENKWDLKERHKFEEVYVELNDLDDDADEFDDDYYDAESEEGENIHKLEDEEDY